MVDIEKYMEDKGEPLERWFPYSGTAIAFRLRYLDIGQAQSVRRKYELMSQAVADLGGSFDDRQAGKEVLMLMVQDWRGFTVREFTKLVRVKAEIKNENPDESIPFSHKTLFMLCEKVPGLEMWVAQTATSIRNFQSIVFEEELKNLEGGQSPTSNAPANDVSKGSSEEGKSGAPQGASAPG